MSAMISQRGHVNRPPPRRNVSVALGSQQRLRQGGSNENLCPSALVKRSRIFSTALSNLTERSSEDPRVSGHVYDSSESTTWAGKSAYKIDRDVATRSPDYDAAAPPRYGIWAAGGEMGSPMSTPQSCLAVHEKLSPDANAFIELLNRSLRLKGRGTGAQEPLMSTPTPNPHMRQTSSSYDSEVIPRVQSPASPPHYNTLRDVDIAKYSESHHRLSDLHSSPTGSEAGGEGHKDVRDNGPGMAEKWHDVPRLNIGTYNQYELVDSQEVLPSDSISQANSPMPEASKLTRSRYTLERNNNCQRPSLSGTIHGMKLQYDGVADARNQDSPNPGVTPRTAARAPGEHLGSKRKASQFSLRSLSTHIPKKARKLRDLASTVIHEGTRRLEEARKKMKAQKDTERKRYNA